MTLKPKCDLQLDDVMLVRDPRMDARGVEPDVEITSNKGEPLTRKLAVTSTDTGETVTVAWINDLVRAAGDLNDAVWEIGSAT